MNAPSSEGESVILAVEDDPGALRIFEEAFDDVDRSVTLIVATDGVAAFDALYRRGEFDDAPRPDLIVLDLNLPDTQGQQILTEIQADDDTNMIPVIVFSQTDDPETISECYRLGANAYITKPMGYDEMRSVADRLHDFWLGTVEPPPI